MTQRYQRIRSVLDRRQPDLTVILDNVHKPHNVSAILRTADAVGVGTVHTCWTGAAPPTFHMTAGGSDKWVRVVRHHSMAAAIGVVRAHGLAVVLADVGEGAAPFQNVDYSAPTAVVFGAELDGPSDATRALCDRRVTIPLHGMVRSLNVSVAAALILYEAERQRRMRGFYDTPRVSAEERARTAFEWLHPAVADYCRRRGMAYPELTPGGDLVGFSVR